MQKENNAAFCTLIAFANTADYVNKYFRNGNHVEAETHMRQNDWVSPAGEKRSSLEFVIDEIKSLEPRADSERAADAPEVADDSPAEDWAQNMT